MKQSKHAILFESIFNTISLFCLNTSMSAPTLAVACRRHAVCYFFVTERINVKIRFQFILILKCYFVLFTDFLWVLVLAVDTIYHYWRNESDSHSLWIDNMVSISMTFTLKKNSNHSSMGRDIHIAQHYQADGTLLCWTRHTIVCHSPGSLHIGSVLVKSCHWLSMKNRVTQLLLFLEQFWRIKAKQ